MTNVRLSFCSLLQLMGDVDNIVREKLHGDTLNSIRKLSFDLQELSAFVKKVTNPEVPLKGNRELE